MKTPRHLLSCSVAAALLAAGWWAGELSDPPSGGRGQSPPARIPRELVADPVASRLLGNGLRTPDNIGAAAEALAGYDEEKLRKLAGALIAHDSPSEDSNDLLKMAVEDWLSKEPWSCLGWLLKKAESGDQVDSLLAMAAKKCSALDLDRALALLNDHPDQEVTRTGFAAILAGSDPSSFGAIFKSISPDDILLHVMQKDLRKRWAEANPEEFLAFAEANIASAPLLDTARNEVLRVLTKTNFGAALELVRADTEKRNFGTSMALVNLIRDAPPDKLKDVEGLLNNLPAGPDRSARIASLAARYAKENPDAALAYADTLSGIERRDALKQIVAALGTGGGENLAALFDRLPTGSSALEAAGDIMRKRSREDPVAAWDLASNLQSPALRAAALKGVLSHWVWTDPEQALDGILAADSGKDMLLDSWVGSMRSVGPRRYAEPMREIARFLGSTDGQQRKEVIDAVRRNLSEEELKEVLANPAMRMLLE
jgi:hypothetical protein